MSKPIPDAVTFTGVSPPWNLASLDADLTNAANAINDLNTYENAYFDQGAGNALLVRLPANITFTQTFGLSVTVLVANTNNANSPSLTLIAFGGAQVVGTIVLPGGGGVNAGALIAGGIYKFVFDGANWQLLATIAVPGGSYVPTFQSGNVQVYGPNGTFAGYGDFIFGFQLPNASGVPSTGLLLGGAGKSQVVYITDEQLPGQKGITVIREAGDAAASPGSDGGGDLLDFAGGTVTGLGGTAKYQGGTSVSGQAGPGILSGGSSTSGLAGDAFVEGGDCPVHGSNVHLIAKSTGGFAGDVRIRVNSTILLQFLSNGEIFLTSSGTGAGLAGQPLVSGGIGAPAKWMTAFTGTVLAGGVTFTFASGLLISHT